MASALGEVEGEVDHKTGLQSSSFMEERIWKAFSMVSSKYSCPSIANSCVVLDPDIVPFTDCSSSILSAKTSLRFRNRKTLTFYLRIENTAKEASDRTKHTQAHSSQQRTQRDSNLLRLKLGRFQVCLLSRSDISNFFKFYSYTIFFILIFSFSLKSYEDKIYIYIYICVYVCVCALNGSSNYSIILWGVCFMAIVLKTKCMCINLLKLSMIQLFSNSCGHHYTNID